MSLKIYTLKLWVRYIDKALNTNAISLDVLNIHKFVEDGDQEAYHRGGT